MSSAAAAGTATATEKRYFCHQCSRTFTANAADGTGLTCAHCHGDFVEEFDLPYPDSNPNPNPSPNPDPDPDLRFSLDDSDAFSAIPSLLSALIDLAAVGPRPAVENPSADADGSPDSPVSVLRGLLQTLSLGGLPGAHGGGRTFVGNIGDYFVGPGLEQLIQQLAEDDPNPYGTPPAGKDSVESLPDVKITEGLLGSDESQCSVCLDSFETGVIGKKMPCRHIYHKECILPWLELHNSCPVCRYELPTDDPDYERRKLTQFNRVDQATSSIGGAMDGEPDAEGSSSVQTRESGGNGDPLSEIH
ncbi:E3 ubiquitin-protein ligase RING1-like [Curcuma longa]|uniref:E3 ubiquitin-protein ligase RING1-like n=1 Tax=Curcuma longa TaxID=136217 RepID=UPI003D9E6111